MHRILLLSSIIFLLFSCKLPSINTESFEGKFIYTISSESNTPDLSDSINYQVIYAKDSMLRIDSYTPIGKQIYIKHIPKNRAYILMDLGFKKVAIQTIPDTLENQGRYEFSYQSGKEKFGKIKASNIRVKDLELDTTFNMNYYASISPKYSTAMKGIPGLPVNYYLLIEGAWANYRIYSIEKKALNIDLFGIPNEYEIITLDDFIDIIQD